MTGYFITVWRSVGAEFVQIGDIVAETIVIRDSGQPGQEKPKE